MKEAERPYHALAPITPKPSTLRAALACAGPLLLAIGGSALAPLPCAFAMAGLPAGCLLLALVAAANEYTTVLLVRLAARHGIFSYEGTVLAAGGPRALMCARIALSILLFGTLCGALATIHETATRAVRLLGYTWLGSDGGKWVLQLAIACVLLPLSLASLGEMLVVSLVGIALMLGIAAFVMVRAAFSGAFTKPPADYQLDLSLGALPEAASLLGYSFYIQPCVLPLLRELPAETAEQTLTLALHMTFGTAAVVYLCVGVGGFLWFGRHTPTDLLTAFSGGTGALLSACFCLYLMLCFAPTLVPLREGLVRLYREQTRLRSRMKEYPVELTPMSASASAVSLARDENDVSLAPLPNAALTSTIIALALATTIVVPQSEALFAVTGATGVCLVAYVFPVLVRLWSDGAHWWGDAVLLGGVLCVGAVCSACSLGNIALGQQASDDACVSYT